MQTILISSCGSRRLSYLHCLFRQYRAYPASFSDWLL